MIVNDVLTTGRSMEQARSELAGDIPVTGVVLFSRSVLPGLDQTGF